MQRPRTREQTSGATAVFRTTIRMTDEREGLLDQAKAIFAEGPHDDPPNSDVIDAALTHRIEPEENLEQTRGSWIQLQFSGSTPPFSDFAIVRPSKAGGGR